MAGPPKNDEFALRGFIYWYHQSIMMTHFHFLVIVFKHYVTCYFQTILLQNISGILPECVRVSPNKISLDGACPTNSLSKGTASATSVLSYLFTLVKNRTRDLIVF